MNTLLKNAVDDDLIYLADNAPGIKLADKESGIVHTAEEWIKESVSCYVDYGRILDTRNLVNIANYSVKEIVDGMKMKKEKDNVAVVIVVSVAIFAILCFV